MVIAMRFAAARMMSGCAARDVTTTKAISFRKTSIVRRRGKECTNDH